MNLLTEGNPKIAKGVKKGYLTFILHLAPSTLSGHNVCPMASAGCKAACLNTAGRGGMFAGFRTAEMTGQELWDNIQARDILNNIQRARIRKTLRLFEVRDDFFVTSPKISKRLSAVLLDWI